MRSPVTLIRCVAAIIAANMAHAELRVWTTADTRHVLRSGQPESRLAVNLGAARNEWASFQILVRSDVPVKILGLEGRDLHGIETRLYREHQLFIETGTYRNKDFKPDGFPDPLIPFKAPAGVDKFDAARFRAVPFDLPANETHGFWVDVFVPTNATAGEHRCVYRLAAEGGKTIEIPLSLAVWNFTLPQTPTLQTEFGSPRLGEFYRQRNEPEPPDWKAVEAQCADLLSEHRINATPPPKMLLPVPQTDGTFRIPPEQVTALRAFIDRRHVNAIQTPHPQSAVKDPEAERDRLRAWLAAFDRMADELHRTNVVFYTYLKDEPNTLEDYRYVQMWGREIRSAKSVVKVLVVEQTWTEAANGGADSAWGDLYGAVDIWCPLFSLHRQDSAAQRQALGETIWTYTALCQGPPTPWWHIDLPLLNYRVPAWIAWRYRMKGLLYWGGMSYWKQTEDPWVHAPIYTGSGEIQQGDKGILYNGEGSLVYPARAIGYDGIVPTIRLKALRDSIEDYEYLSILDRAGKSADAERVVRPLAESFFEWETNPAAYENARAQLAALIAALPQPSGGIE
jgi:hypothetical protein